MTPPPPKKTFSYAIKKFVFFLPSDRSQHRASVAGSTLACEKLKEKLDKQQSQFQLEHEKIMNEANGLKMKTVELLVNVVTCTDSSFFYA